MLIFSLWGIFLILTYILFFSRFVSMCSTRYWCSWNPSRLVYVFLIHIPRNFVDFLIHDVISRIFVLFKLCSDLYQTVHIRVMDKNCVKSDGFFSKFLWMRKGTPEWENSKQFFPNCLFLIFTIHTVEFQILHVKWIVLIMRFVVR